MLGRKRNKDKLQPVGRREGPGAQSSSVSYKTSRTISGIKSSAFKAQPSVDSDRAKSHVLATHRRRTGLFLFYSLLIVVALGWLIYQLTATVKISYNDSRISATVDKAYYEKALSDYLDSHPISRLRLAFDPNAAISELKNKYPEIKEISDIGKDNVFETVYQISFRKPVAGWKINDKQYYVDAEGASFERNYYAAPTVQIIDESGVRVEKGSLITSSRFLIFVGKVVSVASQKGYEVIEAKLPPDSTRQLNIRLNGVKPYIKLSIDRGVAVQLEDMDTALKFLYSKNISPEYVDIRVGSKAFYR